MSSNVADNLRHIRAKFRPEVTLVAVSKTKPNHLLLEAYKAGQRIFGENRVQELAAKSEVLPQDIEWHFIGHLQKNKVKYIAHFVSCIHSVNSLKLLSAINKEAAKNARKIKVLLQFYIATEATKLGLSLAEADEMLSTETFGKMQNIEVVGVMGMATFTDDEKQVRSEFKLLKNIFLKLKETHFSTHASFKEISMGMSGDFVLAIEEGSTMIRVGSSIFGKREQIV